jgi:hypothetical protein
VIMLACHPVSQFRDPGLRFGDRYGLHAGHYTDRS